MGNNIDHKANGYDVKETHYGQRRAYGDTFAEYSVKSDKPQEEVEKYCTEHVYQCKLTSEQYITEEREGVKEFGDHFRPNYKLQKVKDGEYFYQVTRPSTC